MRDRDVPKLVGRVAALVALCAGVYWHVDPLICMGRAVLAYALGLIGYQVWYGMVASNTPVQRLTIEASEPVSAEGIEREAA